MLGNKIELRQNGETSHGVTWVWLLYMWAIGAPISTLSIALGRFMPLWRRYSLGKIWLRGGSSFSMVCHFFEWFKLSMQVKSPAECLGMYVVEVSVELWNCTLQYHHTLVMGSASVLMYLDILCTIFCQFNYLDILCTTLCSYKCIFLEFLYTDTGTHNMCTKSSYTWLFSVNYTQFN